MDVCTLGCLSSNESFSISTSSRELCIYVDLIFPKRRKRDADVIRERRLWWRRSPYNLLYARVLAEEEIEMSFDLFVFLRGEW